MPKTLSIALFAGAAAAPPRLRCFGLFLGCVRRSDWRVRVVCGSAAFFRLALPLAPPPFLGFRLALLVAGQFLLALLEVVVRLLGHRVMYDGSARAGGGIVFGLLDRRRRSPTLWIIGIADPFAPTTMAAHREFKDALYTQFARIGHALASPKRIELLDLLGQGEKSVDALAEQLATPIKNTSAHLRVLRQARLVETRRDGTWIYYRLADDDVFRLLRALESLGHSRLADVQHVVRSYLDGHDELQPVTFRELRRLVRDGDVTVLDVRPAEEYRAGHIPGAVSMPVPELKRRLREIPKSREVIAYCRGRYCVYSLEAVKLLRKQGYRARRAHEGLPDWRAAGLPVENG